MTKIKLAELQDCVGVEATSAWLEITQDQVNRFADVTGDDQWVHLDINRATREIGGTIVHGWLIVSLIPVLSRRLMDIHGISRRLNYGADKIRFVSPVQTGKRIRLHLKLQGAEAKSEGTLIRYVARIEVEGQARPACIAETLVLALPA